MQRNLSFEEIGKPLRVQWSDENATRMTTMLTDPSEEIQDELFLLHRYLDVIRKPTPHYIEIALGFEGVERYPTTFLGQALAPFVGIKDLFQRLPYKRVGISTLVLLALALSTCTLIQNGVRYDPFSIFGGGVKRAIWEARPYVIRGNARKAQGDLTGAIADYDRALKIDPNDSLLLLQTA